MDLEVSRDSCEFTSYPFLAPFSPGNHPYRCPTIPTTVLYALFALIMGSWANPAHLSLLSQPLALSCTSNFLITTTVSTAPNTIHSPSSPAAWLSGCTALESGCFDDAAAFEVALDLDFALDSVCTVSHTKGRYRGEVNPGSVPRIQDVKVSSDKSQSSDALS